MSTRQRIINQAIELFNQQGIANVSVADICKALAISKGNLTYHFANKALVVEAVFEHLIDDIGARIAEFQQSDSGSELANYYQLISQTDKFTHQYSFFYTDILEVIRNYPTIAERYRNLMTMRKTQGLDMMRQWVEQGLLQPEPMPGHYQNIQHSLWMVMTFWRSQTIILPSDNPNSAMANNVLHVLWPYLTKQGKSEINAIFEHQPKSE